MKFRILLIGVVLCFWEINTQAQVWSGFKPIKGNDNQTVDISENYAIMTNKFDYLYDQGTAEIYKRQDTSWVFQTKLVYPNYTDSDDSFYFPASISENYAVLGIPSKTINGQKTGGVHIYKREGEEWIYDTFLTISEGTEDEYFGFSIDLFEDYIIIGAHKDQTNNKGEGSAYIFKNESGRWVQKARLNEPDVFLYGHAVSIFGDYAVVGAPYDTLYSPYIDYGSGSSQYATYGGQGFGFVYKKNGEKWEKTAQIKGSSFDQQGGFGYNLATNGDYIIVSEPNYGFYNDGRCFLFRRKGEVWKEVKIIEGEFAYGNLGQALAINDKYITLLTKSIKSYVYQILEDNLQLVQEFKGGIDYNANDLLWSVGMSKNRLILGNIYSANPFVYISHKIPKNTISGKVYHDYNQDCKPDLNEKPLPQTIVKATPGPYYASVDDKGDYKLEVGADTYNIQQINIGNPNLKRDLNCPKNPDYHTINFKNDIEEHITDINFANQIKECSLLKVDVSSSRRRRCFKGQTTVSYCNEGLIMATNAVVEVKFPEYILPLSSSLAWNSKKGNTYKFNVGNLAPGECKQIIITDSVACDNNALGLTQCVEARISPKSTCISPSPQWNGASLEASGECIKQKEALTVFKIKNTGSAGMSTASPYRIYADTKIVYEGSVQLAKGDSLVLELPTQGKSIRLEVNQVAYHPDNKQISTTVEGCQIANKAFSAGVAMRFIQQEEETGFEKSCQVIVGSADPNDKQVIPEGITENKYVPVGTKLEYTLRFQNTGTAEAINIVVIDTLSENLAMETFEMMSSSHPYELSVSGKGRPILTWTFKNINLPDSTSNEAQSHGYIKFKVSHKSNIIEGTKIQNFGDIYFDFNEPVRTNTTSNIIQNYAFERQLVNFCDLVRQAEVEKDKIICANKTTLQGNIPSYGQGKWVLVSGSGNFTEVNSPQTEVNNLGYGENIFKWMISSPECSSSEALIKITRLHEASPAQVGNSQEVCGTNTQLTANQPINGQGKWTLVKGIGKIQNPNVPNSQVDELAYGENIFRWSIGNGLCDSTHSELKINRLREASLALAGDYQEICADNTILSANTPTIGQGKWKLKQGKGTIVNPYSPQTAITNLGYGENIFDWAIGNGLCDSTHSQLIIKRLNPIANSVSISSNIQNDFICSGKEVIFTANPQNGGTNPIYEWKINGKAIGSNTKTLKTNTLQKDDVVSLAMKSSEKCPSPEIVISNSLKINVLPSPPRPQIEQSELYKLQANLSGDKYEWYQDGILLNESIKMLKISQLGDYEVIVWEGQCRSEKSEKFVLNAETLDKFKDQKQVNLFPNPSQGKFTLSIQNNQGSEVNITLTNQLGKVLQTYSLPADQQIDWEEKLDISHLDSGIYFLQIQNQKMNSTKRINVKH